MSGVEGTRPEDGVPAPPDGGPQTGPPGSWRRFHRGRWALSVLVALLVVIAVAAAWDVPYYAITPGQAIPVGELISLPHRLVHDHRGEVVLTDVELTRLSALGYAYYYVEHRSELVGAAHLTGGESSSEYNEEGVIDMASARQAAALVALRTLGYKVRAKPTGVVVYAIEPGTPARLVPPVGDVLTSADGTSTPTIARLRAQIGTVPAGGELTVTYHRLGSDKSHQRRVRVDVLVRSGDKSSAHTSCVAPSAAGKRALLGKNGTPQRCLPLYVEPQYRDVDEPFSLRIRSGGIVGPSAGLSFTLGVIDELDRGDLTAGRRVAATGTMANDGAVGAVGGVAEKTRAVRAAGASVFLVPPSGLAAARANAGPSLKIIAVSSISEAVSALEHLGGRLSSAAPA